MRQLRRTSLIDRASRSRLLVVVGPIGEMVAADSLALFTRRLSLGYMRRAVVREGERSAVDTVFARAAGPHRCCRSAGSSEAERARAQGRTQRARRAHVTAVRKLRAQSSPAREANGQNKGSPPREPFCERKRARARPPPTVPRWPRAFCAPLCNTSSTNNHSDQPAILTQKRSAFSCIYNEFAIQTLNCRSCMHNPASHGSSLD